MPSARHANKPHPLSTALVMLAVAGFWGLLFFLTNWHPRAPERTSERGLIKKVTTGEFAHEEELLEKGSHHNEE